MDNKEKWKEIIGYKGRYLVSNFGKIKSLISTYNGKTLIVKERLLKPIPAKGYLRIALTDSEGKVKYHLIHRLVIDTFAGFKEGKEVNHIDGNKLNNRLSNLEWCTRRQNMLHAYKIGLERPANNGIAKKIIVIKDGCEIEIANSIREVCAKYKLDRRSVQRTIKGVYRNTHGYNFRVL